MSEMMDEDAPEDTAEDAPEPTGHVSYIPTRAIYHAAADHIARYGLSRGRFSFDHDRPKVCAACAIGAILIAATGKARTKGKWFDLIKPLAAVKHLDGDNRYEGVGRWSDRTTASDVICTLRAIAETLP